MRRSNDFRRQGLARPIGHRIIIVCEGEKTECGYFRDVRDALNLNRRQVIVRNARGTDPLAVVQTAIGERQQLKDRRVWAGERDLVWAVYDGDEHIANHPQRWEEAIILARKESIELAISNPCFELWYLLHFQDQFGNLSKSKTLRALKGHLPSYDKSNVLYQSTLKDETADAITRAIKLGQQNIENGLPPFANPCTHVSRLVETVLALRKETR